MFIAFKVGVFNGKNRILYDLKIKDITTDIKSMYFIDQFKTYNIIIDDNVETNLEKLVNEVKAECPVAKHFGISAHGEGIVFSCGQNMFKVKGDIPINPKTTSMNMIEVQKSIMRDTLTDTNLRKYLFDDPSVEVYVDRILTEIRSENDTLDPKYVEKMCTDIKHYAIRWYTNLHAV